MVDVHKPAPLAAAVFALLALALLLFTTNPGLRPLQRDHTSSSLTSRSEAAFDQSLNSHAKRIALPFGHHDVATNFTSLPRSVQRATKLNYQYAACKGEKLWKQIQDAFDGQHPPGRQFGSNDFANGWTLTPVTGGLGGLPAGWDNAFRTFAGANNQVPNPNAISNLNLFQDQAFLNSQGNLVQDPTTGRYNLLYIPSYNAMVARFVESPSYRVAHRPPGQQPPAANIPDLIPPLHRLSDVSWYIYGRISPNPGGLRYMGHHFIGNPDTVGIIDRLLQATFDTDSPNVPWPGASFDIETEAAKALLATPNGVGVAYLMMDRAAALGRRRPRVNVWNGNGFRSMLWDMVPVP